MLAETRRITLPLLLMTAATSVVASQEPVKKEFPTLGTVDPTAAVERHWKYDYATGEITPIALPPKGTLLIEPQSKSSGTANLDACFENIDDFPFFTSTPVTHQELVDWGTKSCGSGCLVTSFTFRYRSPNPTASLSIAFYLGTTGFGNLGTEIQRFSFQGLPSGDPFLNVFANTMTVDISSTPMCLPDGPIGWSYTNDDLDTGIFLTEGPWDSNIIDALDVYDNPPATNGDYSGTFNFASMMVEVGSLQIQLEEEDNPTLAGIRLREGNGANPIALIPRNVPAIGLPWFAVPNFDLVPGSDTSTFLLSAAPLPPISTVAGEILIDLFSPPLLVETTDSFHRVDIPTSLTGQTFYGQAVLFGGGTLQLTNGLELVIGI